MFRIIIGGYILGGALIIVAAVTAAPSAVIFTAVLGIVIFIAVIAFTYRHYIKMNDKYYKWGRGAR